MNTGHNLRKLGESYLGFVNRIWIANQGSFKVTKSDERALVLDIIDRGYSGLKGAIGGRQDYDTFLLRAANYYERSMSLAESKPTAEIYKDNLVSNCPDCASIGYHSNYFNTSWLNICPVHKRPLTFDCSTCNRLWAGPSEIRARNCQDCGPRMSFRSLTERDAFDSKIYAARFNFLNEYFQRPSAALQLDVVHNDFSRKTRRVQTNHFHSKAYPSFVAAEHQFNDSQLTELEVLKVRLFSIDKIEFSYEQECELPDPANTLDLFREAAFEVRKEVLRLASRELLNSKDLDHPLAHCELQYFRNPATCPVCNTHKITKLSLSDSKFNGFNELFYYQSINEYDHAAPEPGILTGVKENGKLLPFPTKISMLLYQIELWTQIRVMYYKLDRCVQAEIPPNMTLIDWGELNPDIASSSDNYSFPYFVTRDGDTGKLYVPKIFLDTNIETDSDFRELIFPAR